MYLVSLDTLKSAQRRGAPRAYLARLAPGPRGSIERLFVKPRKVSDSRAALESACRPGDVFEARRWLWDDNRQQYYGGTVWFGVDAQGGIVMLTREEAFAAVLAPRVEDATPPTTLPVAVTATRMVPDDIRLVPWRGDADKASQGSRTT